MRNVFAVVGVQTEVQLQETSIKAMLLDKADEPADQTAEYGVEAAPEENAAGEDQELDEDTTEDDQELVDDATDDDLGSTSSGSLHV